MTVGELKAFLALFDDDQEVAFFFEGEDRLTSVDAYAENSGEPIQPDYPVIVLNW